MKSLPIFILLMSIIYSFSSFSQGSENAMEFNGTDQYIENVNYTNMSPTDEVTVEAWIKGEPTAGFGFVYDRIETNDGYGLLVYATGEVALSINGAIAEVRSNTEIFNGQWYHAAGTYSKHTGLLKIYINGVLENNQLYNASITYNPEPRNAIGGPGSHSKYFKGAIDEVRVWNTERSNTQIRDNMCRSLTGSENGLIGYWNLNEGTGPDVTDLTGNNTGCKIKNNASWIGSGAAIGDQSVHAYTNNWSNVSLSISHPGPQDSIRVHNIINSPSGVHLYIVESAPENALGIDTLDGNDRYFGVYATNYNAGFDLDYNYIGNPHINNENSLELYQRKQHNSPMWDYAIANLDTANKVLSYVSDSSRKEVILGNHSVLGFNESINNFEIKLFPIPAKDFIQVEFSNDLDYPIEMTFYNSNEELINIYHLNSNNSTIKIRNWANGIYGYRFTQGSKTIKTGKIIVIK